MANAHPHAPPPMSQQQLAQTQAMEQQRREQARRRAHKPTDKNIPEGVEQLALGDGVNRYRALRDLERRLDAVMMRKRMDIQESTNRSMKRTRTLRIWISNSVDNQPWQQGAIEPESFVDFGTDSQGTFRVKIEGRLLEDDEDRADGVSESKGAGDGDERDAGAMDQDPDPNKTTPTKQPLAGSAGLAPQRFKLSHFFKAITVEFDKSKILQIEGIAPVEWKKPEAKPNQPQPSKAKDADFDCLEFERKGDENINIVINLTRDENPERYRLNKPLADIVDKDEDDRAGIMHAIMEYVKANNLSEEKDFRKVTCDDALKKVFGRDIVHFPEIPDLIQQHVTPLPPLQLPYTIRVDRDYTDNPVPTVYDIPVACDDPPRNTMLALARDTGPNHLNALRQVAALDDSLALVIQAMANGKAKHDFFSSMADDPVRFLQRWLASQRRDADVILGDPVEGAAQTEEWRIGGKESVWSTDGARESVGLWLARMK
ncbi:hypothetical protein BDY21DRAFT_283773 [Lineolata rhizophorae]|uniref:DM2 domain-containing protein n=1 Tax=Lineolata rhizophorae TaxID=578093 RepID=A0A6A6P4K7_9PEZI|nr:hypothetical protein BDY21DRAFT_283773 [Lineolata rhizophorae]